MRAVIGNQVFQVRGHGGRREGAGRKPGAFNRVTADVRAIAQPYGASAIAELARLAGLTDAPGAANEATRVAALRELLDRAYGRSLAVIAGDEERGPIVVSFEWADAASASPPAVAEAVIDDDTHADTVPLTLEWESCC
jgi:hypothetical protein